jgi:hypothetical protein
VEFNLKTIKYQNRAWLVVKPTPALMNSRMIREIIDRGSLLVVNPTTGLLTAIAPETSLTWVSNGARHGYEGTYIHAIPWLVKISSEYNCVGKLYADDGWFVETRGFQDMELLLNSLKKIYDYRGLIG